MSYGNKDRPSERENGTRWGRKNVGWQKILKVVDGSPNLKLTVKAGTFVYVTIGNPS